jgi:1-acyl-sn-glycerol-3-phosphate acyltransferase
MFLIVIVLGQIIVPARAIFAKNKKAKNDIYHWGAIIFGKALLLLGGIRVSVQGLENIPKGTAVILMPNHQGHWDYPILFSLIPLRFAFVMKKELFKVPLLGSYWRRAGYFSIDREAGRSALETLEKVIKAIKAGESVLVFPEGTRTWDGQIGQFKRGAFMVAAQAHVPIVPIAISGSFEIMRRHSWLIKPGEVRVKVGPPLNFVINDETDKDELLKEIERVKSIIQVMFSSIEYKNG